MAVNLNNLTATQTLVNTNKLFVETAGGARSITFENLKKSQEGYFKRVIAEYMQFDYEDLKALRDDGELIAGQKYLLTDYQTVYRQDRGGTYEDKTSDVEPLILTAVSTNEFSQVAYSPSYPQDIIWYNFDNELNPDNTSLFYNSLDRISREFKGIIIRRIDTQKNIDYSYDWRTMLWWRGGNEVLTFADLNSVHNIVSGSNCYDNVFGSNCFRNTFGSNCYGNTFRSYCSINTFGEFYFGNTFGNYCYNNVFGNSCSGNTFGNTCSGNTFDNYCSGNTFDNFLQYADVKSNFSNATVTNTAIYGKDYNHTFYIDSSGNMKCYCINSSGAITDVPLGED